MLFSPAVSGSATIQAQSAAFIAAFMQRIERGLLQNAPHWRSRYVVTTARSDALAFRAADWWTAINVGLNEVELSGVSHGRVQYSIRYWRWACYALLLSGAIGAMLVGVLLIIDVRSYIAQHPASAVPGLSTDQNVLIAWAMAIFWGFVWPWLLVALHKRPLRRLMERLIAEVDAAAARDEDSTQSSQK